MAGSGSRSRRCTGWTQWFGLAIALTLFQQTLADIAIDNPEGTEQCTPFNFSWTGGTPPFYLLFNTTVDVISQLASDNGQNETIIAGLGYGNIYAQSFTATLNFPYASNVQLQVIDSKNITSVATFLLGQGPAGNACEIDFQVNSLVPVDGAGGPLDASDAFFIENLKSCADSQFTFLGGQPPYTISLRTTGLPVLQEQIFAGFSGVQSMFKIPFPAGVSLQVAVEDSTGQQAISPTGTIKAGTDSSCLISVLTSANAPKYPNPTTNLPQPSIVPIKPTSKAGGSSTSSKPSTSATPSSSSAVSNSSQATAPSSADTAPTHSIALTPGAIAGIVVGIVSAIWIVLCAVGILCHARRLARRRSTPTPFVSDPRPMSGYSSANSEGLRLGNVSVPDSQFQNWGRLLQPGYGQDAPNGNSRPSSMGTLITPTSPSFFNLGKPLLATPLNANPIREGEGEHGGNNLNYNHSPGPEYLDAGFGQGLGLTFGGGDETREMDARSAPSIYSQLSRPQTVGSPRWSASGLKDLPPVPSLPDGLTQWPVPARATPNSTENAIEDPASPTGPKAV